MSNSIVTEKRGSLDVLKITTAHSTAEITPYGAHVLSFAPHGSEDLLWVSGKSLFQEGKAIRGGIPVCWPWFGKVKKPNHGLARIALWQLLTTREEPDGSETLTFGFQCDECKLAATVHVNVGKALTVELVTCNKSEEVQTLSMALHTYFSVGDSTQIKILGFEGAPYACKVENREAVQDGAIVIDREVDRIYEAGTRRALICDPVKKRNILVERLGSLNAVVWNPWVEKSIGMADFGDEEYKTMVCIEAANVGANQPVLAPGGSFAMTTRVSLA